MADIALTDSFDLGVSIDGDLPLAPDEQALADDITLLLATALGHWRESPLVGLAIHEFINSDESPTAAITEALQADGMRAVRVSAADPLNPIIRAQR
jgi:hypothetical protein